MRTYILDDHDQKGQLYAQSLILVGRTGDVVCGHVSAHDLEHARLNVLICDALDVTVPHLFVPYLKWLAAYTVQDRQKPRLKRILEHAAAHPLLPPLFVFSFWIAPCVQQLEPLMHRLERCPLPTSGPTSKHTASSQEYTRSRVCPKRLTLLSRAPRRRSSAFADRPNSSTAQRSLTKIHELSTVRPIFVNEQKRTSPDPRPSWRTTHRHHTETVDVWISCLTLTTEGRQEL